MRHELAPIGNSLAKLSGSGSEGLVIFRSAVEIKIILFFIKTILYSMFTAKRSHALATAKCAGLQSVRDYNWYSGGHECLNQIQ